ncbi:hypothetical protein Hte_005007 [Hypoxylon texense]
MGACCSQLSTKPTFTEANVGPQDGKVFLITGGTSGIGLALAKMLYRKRGRVWITGRSPERGRKAIQAIRKAAAATTEQQRGGSVEFLLLHLDDLDDVREAASEFMAKETRLHVLWNNAGVMHPPAGVLSAQGFEMHLATNCLGPYLLAQLLKVMLVKTANAAAAAAAAAPGSVRIVWSSGRDAAVSSPPRGVVMGEVRASPSVMMMTTMTTTMTMMDKRKKKKMTNEERQKRSYAMSKAGNMFLASEFARVFVGSGSSIVCASVDPGPAATRLFRYTRCFKYVAWARLPRPKRAARTLLYAGLSGDITAANSGCYVVPGPKIEEDLRPDLFEAMLPEGVNRGSGRAEEFYKFCSEATHEYRHRDPNPRPNLEPDPETDPEPDPDKSPFGDDVSD